MNKSDPQKPIKVPLCSKCLEMKLLAKKIMLQTYGQSGTAHWMGEVVEICFYI